MVRILNSIGILAALYLVSCGMDAGSSPGSSSSSDSGSTRSCTTCRIFRTAATQNAKFGSIAGADTFCESDTNHPGGEFKALIVDGSSRRACLTPDCTTGTGEHIDWVLYSNTTYTRLDGTVIGTTNTNGLFTFPLTNAMNSSGTNSWTGLSTNWTNATDCINWTSDLNKDKGFRSVDSATDTDAIGESQKGCANTYGLLCVEQ